MFSTRAPLLVHAAIRDLCDWIRPDIDPVFVRIEIDDSDQPSDCFFNVRRRIEREGGSIQFGWAIWEWPRVFVEAEHHAVFAPADGGPWKDVTPCEIPGSRRRLFLPDNAAVYDFENQGQLRDNVRMALSSSPLVQEMFDAASERVRILNSIPGVGAVTASLETARSLQATTLKVMELQHEIGMTHTPPRTPCFCGRGKMFKQCHGR